MAAVIGRIQGDEALAPRRKQDMVAALRTTRKAIRLTPENAPAHPAFLQDRPKAFLPSMLERPIKPERWRNVQSLTRTALKHAGVPTNAGRYREPIARD